MFALLTAAHTINFGETYTVRDDPNKLKDSTAPCYGIPKDTMKSCPGFGAVVDSVGGNMVPRN